MTYEKDSNTKPLFLCVSGRANAVHDTNGHYGGITSPSGKPAHSHRGFCCSDIGSSEVEESSDPVSSEEDTTKEDSSSEASKGELPSSDTAYGTSSDAVAGSIGEEWRVEKAHLFPGTVVLVDENGDAQAPLISGFIEINHKLCQ